MKRKIDLTSLRSKNKGKLPGIQFLRAFAAIAVVFHHVAAQIHSNTGNIPTLSIEGIGGRGVQLFFAISGFIIFYAHSYDLEQPRKIPNYFAKRIIRIIPATFIVSTTWFAIVYASSLVGLDTPNITLPIWASSAFVLPMFDQPSPSAIWSLRNEFIFYAIFASFMLNIRLGIVFFGVWFASCLVIAAPTELSEIKENILFLTVFSETNIIFVFGIVAFLLHQQLHTNLSRLLAPFLIIFCILAWWNHSISTVSSFIFGLSSGLTILAAAQYKMRGAIEHFSTFLGNASFAIYLTHMPVIAMSFPILTKLGLSTDSIYIIEPILCVILGCLFFVFVETPVTKSLSSYILHRKPRRHDSPPLA